MNTIECCVRRRSRAELTSQHEAALTAALAQKDEQLGARLSEYEGQLARMVTERAALQTSTREEVAKAAAECDAARAELQRVHTEAQDTVENALNKLNETATNELISSHEAILASRGIA